MESFDLKPVVEVEIATMQGRRKTGYEIGRHEQRPPNLALPHVYALVRASRLQRPAVPSYHNVTERQGRGPAGHECETRQQPCQRWSVRLNDTLDDAHLRMPEAAQHHHKTEGRCRRRPDVPNDGRDSGHSCIVAKQLGGEKRSAVRE